MADLPFALQLYTVRDSMDRAPEATLEQVKAMGYNHVELAGLAGLTAERFRAALDAAGLAAISAHVPLDELAGDPDAAIAMVETLGVDYVAVPWLGGEETPDRSAWEQYARTIDAAGAALREHGVQLCYHNHAHEFESIEGVSILDILFSGPRENLAAEIDVYWARVAGADPARLIRRFSGRAPLVHVKDMTADQPPAFAEMGQGVMEWEPIFAAAAQAGVEWLIVEQDECAGDPLESARISAEYMLARP